VAILVTPTRGQALEKACWRMVATIIGLEYEVGAQLMSRSVA
jgi:hypothetical protein